MEHDYLEKLKQTHPTLRLLTADNSPLIKVIPQPLFVLRMNGNVDSPRIEMRNIAR